RGAGAGPHDEQAQLLAPLLELRLLVQRDVVAEQQDVQPLGERVVGLQRRVVAGHGDDGDGRAGQLLDGPADGAGRDGGRLTGFGGGVLVRGLRAGVERGLRGVLVAGADGEDEVVRPGLPHEVLVEALGPEVLPSGRRGHDGSGPGDAVLFGHDRGGDEQAQRVEVRVTYDADAGQIALDAAHAVLPACLGTMRVPTPLRASSASSMRSADVMTAVPSLSRTKSMDARILGPMLPAGNWPSARYCSAWVRDISWTGRARGVP